MMSLQNCIIFGINIELLFTVSQHLNPGLSSHTTTLFVVNMREWPPFSWDSWSTTFCPTPLGTWESNATPSMSASKNAWRKWKIPNPKWRKILERYKSSIHTIQPVLIQCAKEKNLKVHTITGIHLKTCSFFRSVMKLPRWRRTLICLERPSETRRIQWRFPRLGWTTARIGQVWSSAGTQYSTSKQAYPIKSGIITGNIVFSLVI